MKVRELMTKDVAACRSEDSLAEAARLMWDNDCGCVPIIDDQRRVTGMITDRDICMAAFFKNAPLKNIPIESVMARRLFCCRAQDPIENAEALMKEHQVRRLPVVDDQGRLAGILSLNDLALEFEREQSRGNKEIDSREVAETVAAVCEHTHARSAAS